jgi:hypothetical protein
MTSPVDSSHLTKPVHDSLHVAEQATKTQILLMLYSRHSGRDCSRLYILNHKPEPGRNCVLELAETKSVLSRLPPSDSAGSGGVVAIEGSILPVELLYLLIYLQGCRRNASILILISLKEHTYHLTHSSFRSLLFILGINLFPG